MSIRKAKTAAKSYLSDQEQLKKIVLRTMKKVSDIVSSSLGPGGRVTLIEESLPNLPNRLTKDGVTIFKNLGSNDAYEHLIIESARDAAVRTASTVGDGPQPLYSNVLTPKGFVEMRDLRVGMEICGTNGTIQKVLGIYPKDQKEIYEVEIHNKGIVECCEDHLWSVTYNNDTQKVMPLKALIGDYKTISSDGSNRYKYYTPSTHVEYYENKSEMPLDPYLVGVLLGDGCLRESGSIELSLGEKKGHIINKLVLSEGIVVNSNYVDNKNSFRVKITGKDKNGKTIRDHVSSLGLSNTNSFTKFIPKSYLRSSKASREALFQGLIDTDGHINDRGLFEFSSVSKELSDDFAELAMGLGKTIYRRLQERSTEDGAYSNTPVYRIWELKGYKYGNKIIGITKTGNFTEMQCIKVSNPDNLYITDNFVVTHNTTTATVLSYNIIKNMFDFCEANPKYSPQKAIRKIHKTVKEILIPYIEQRAIKITEENKHLIRKVAEISANGDKELADAVIQAFELLGYSDSSHVTIREATGPNSFKVDRIDGMPIPEGCESLGKFSNIFINDQASLRCHLLKPTFILFDGMVNDLISITPILNMVGEAYSSGDENFKNVVIVAHGFSDSVMTTLAYNFANPSTINIVPLRTPMAQFNNSQQQFLLDLASFCNAKVFGLKDPLNNAMLKDLGTGMESFEMYRFRSTVVGDSDALNIEVRAEELKKMKENSESIAEKIWLEERLGKLTGGIVKLTIFSNSSGSLKEISDRVEDAVCSAKSAITYGCLPGGCRIALDMCILLGETLPEGDPGREVLMASLLCLPQKLFSNAGYNEDEIDDIVKKMLVDRELVYDIENEKFGKAEELGLFDATRAVQDSLSNSVSIAALFGAIGGIISFERDPQFEREEAKADADFMRNVENPLANVNEANLRS